MRSLFDCVTAREQGNCFFDGGRINAFCASQLKECRKMIFVLIVFCEVIENGETFFALNDVITAFFAGIPRGEIDDIIDNLKS